MDFSSVPAALEHPQAHPVYRVKDRRPWAHPSNLPHVESRWRPWNNISEAFAIAFGIPIRCIYIRIGLRVNLYVSAEEKSGTKMLRKMPIVMTFGILCSDVTVTK